MSNLLKNFAAQYDADIVTGVFDGLSEVPAAWRSYFNVSETDRYITNTTGYSGFGAAPEWKDGAPIPLDQPTKIYDNSITQSFYGLGFMASRKLIKYGDMRTILKWAKALGRSLGQTYGTTHADVLNNAFTTTYASLGTVALISASHVSSGAATRSNINASAALTPANLEVLIVQGMNATDYRGKNDPMMYQKLIIPPSLRRTAVKILQSTQESGHADNDINTQRGMLEIIVDPFMDGSTTHYFLQGANHGLMSLHGQLPENDEYMVNSSKGRVYTIAADWGNGVEYWEHMAGSQGA